MIVRELETFVVAEKRDLPRVSIRLAAISEKMGMGNLKKTELRTAVSELLTNMLRYAGGGKVVLEQLEHREKMGIRATFEDDGPGIPDLKAALSKGFTTGKSMGLGLPGCKNLVDFFDLLSEPGKGTRVVITKWC